jgi:hypothetical protein
MNQRFDESGFVNHVDHVIVVKLLDCFSKLVLVCHLNDPRRPHSNVT